MKSDDNKKEHEAVPQWEVKKVDPLSTVVVCYSSEAGLARTVELIRSANLVHNEACLC